MNRAWMRVRTAAFCIALLTGCGGATPSSDQGAAPAPAELTVFAAASLTDVFTALKTRFETDNAGVTVRFNFGASSDLSQQIVNGAPADVFAAASDATMTTVTDAQLAESTPTVFATNELEIVTLPGNPKGITSFADLGRSDLKVVVCAPQVPCGSAVVKIEKATGLTLMPVSEESDVKATLGKVSTGNADAGLVYVTDVAAAKNTVEGITFPEAGQATTNYPIAVLKDAPQATTARKFLDMVTGDVGVGALDAAGFRTP